MPRCGATTDENVGGARVSADTRTEILFSDPTFPGRRWDSASHIHQAIFRGGKLTRLLLKIDSRYNHPALSRSIGR